LAKKAGSSDIAFSILGIDEKGLSPKHREILSYLSMANKPCSLESISFACNLSKEDVSSLYERDLIRHKMIARTPGGRVITGHGRDHIKREDPRD
jgi:Holliday junction resolvasome RuvABC ATP-dependent DNA helicase subunit